MRRFGVGLLLLVVVGACDAPARPEVVVPRSTSTGDVAPAKSSPASAPDFARCSMVLDEAERDQKWPAIGEPVTAPAVALPDGALAKPEDVNGCRAKDVMACVRFARTLQARGESAHAVFDVAADIVFERGLETVGASPAGPRTDALKALKAFRQSWYGVVLPSLDRKVHELPHALADCMAGDPHYAVSLIERRMAHRRTYWLVTALAENGAHFLLHGKLEDLVGTGDLWMVFYGGSLPDRPPSSSFVGYVDADTGKLLVAAELPEG